MKDSKKDSKKIFFYYTILDSIKTNPIQAMHDIADKLHITKQNIVYYTNVLQKHNLLKKVGKGTWELTETGKEALDSKNFDFPTYSKKNSSLGTTTHLHALNFSFPILKGDLNLIDVGGYTQEKFKNWLPQYKKYINPIGFTVKNNNNKSIDVFLFSRPIQKTEEIFSLILKSSIFLHDELKNKGVVIDVFDIKLKTMHLWVKNEDLEKVLNKGETVEVFLNRNRTKVSPNDNEEEAKAWTDSSPFRGVETNDIDYMTHYLLMPENIIKIKDISKGTKGDIQQLIGVLNNYAATSEALATHIKSHIGMVEDTRNLVNGVLQMMQPILNEKIKIKEYKNERQQRRISEYV